MPETAEIRRTAAAMKTIQPHLTAEKELEQIEIGARARLSWDDWSTPEGPGMRVWYAQGRPGPRPGNAQKERG